MLSVICEQSGVYTFLIVESVQCIKCLQYAYECVFLFTNMVAILHSHVLLLSCSRFHYMLS